MPVSENKKPLRISLEEVLSATDYFRAKPIGEGGFGKVFKAKLPSFPDEDAVAIKRSNPQGRQGEDEFLNEIKLLSRFNNTNLISLIGYCYQGSEMIIVYEFASKGSLEDLLLSSDDLPWVRRLQICLDAALGLEYIHNGVGDQHRIIHRDIKCANILIDQHGQAKISDFGLSKAVHVNRPVSYLISKNIAGTVGYVDPQYRETGILKKESDVYSFGVVLLEVFCRELTNDPIRAGDEQLASVARKWADLGRLDEVLDPELADKITDTYSISNNEINRRSLDAFSAIMGKCLKVKQGERPTMGEVVKELEKALKLQVKGIEDLRISLDDIRHVTAHFSNHHDVKGFDGAKMYNAVIPCYKGRRTATVVRYDAKRYPATRDYFRNELELLIRCNHENIISLLGFSDEDGEHIMVLEYAASSIDKVLESVTTDHAHSEYAPTWMQLLKICIGVASGLYYLQNEHNSIHRNIKKHTILLNENWVTKIAGLQFAVEQTNESSSIVGDVVATFGYIDIYCARRKILSKKSDVFSFGTVLLEVLFGRSIASRDHDGSRFPLTREEFSKTPEVTINTIIMEQIAPETLKMFTEIAYQCRQDLPSNRPTIHLVRKELEKSLTFQENYEWEPKLPKNYKDIIRMAKSEVKYSTIKELYYILYSGILLNNGHLFSLSEHGEKCEMVPATKFSSRKRRALRKSRFPKVAKMLDSSNLNLHVNIKTEYLSLGIPYAAYLVVKFCEQKKITRNPIYVGLKYTRGAQTDTDSSITYFAEWGDNGWMKINLGYHTIIKDDTHFEVHLMSISRRYCGRGGLYIEGIEFLPIENAGLEVTNMSSDENDVPHLHIYLQQQLISDYQGIIKRSENHMVNATISELYDLLSAGILIDNGKKFFFMSKLDGKKCHMLPARECLHESSNKNRFHWSSPPEKHRFDEHVELVSYHEFRLKCGIETEMLSSDTVYACYLVYKISENCRGLQCPMKAKNLLPTNKKMKRKTSEATTVFLRPPTEVNALRSINHPASRKDGWMEVKVWEFNAEVERNRRHHPLNLKLICVEGNMSGLILYGIEFRPKWNSQRI